MRPQQTRLLSIAAILLVCVGAAAISIACASPAPALPYPDNPAPRSPAARDASRDPSVRPVDTESVAVQTPVVTPVAVSEPTSGGTSPGRQIDASPPTLRINAEPSRPSAPASTAGPSANYAPVDTAITKRLEGLWAGDLIPEPGQTSHSPPWLSMRVRPGNDPDRDRWRLESGPWPDLLPPVSRCTPERREDGWLLSSCSGVEPEFEIFVPIEEGASLDATVRDIGVTARASLSKIEATDEPQMSNNVTVLWHQPGDGIHTDIWVDDGFVVAPRADGVIEILNAEDGSILSTVGLPGTVFDVKSHDGILYAATGYFGLLVFDISDPTDPESIGNFQPTITGGAQPEYSNFHNIFLSPDGRYVYAANNTEFPQTDLVVIDVSDPTSPTEAGRFSLSTDNLEHNFHVTHDVNVIEVEGKLIAFLNYLSAGLWILDVTDPAAIAPLGSISWDGTFSHSGWPFFLGGRLYYAHNSEGYDRHMTILDVTDLAEPTIVSRFAGRDGVSIHNVEVVDGIAYISYYIDGLRVVDLRDPENPREIAHFDTVPNENERGIAQGAWGIRVVDGVVYLSDLESGIFAFKVDME